MPTRRVIKAVLGNFLGTYVSRYSDYNGYLLFGFLVDELTDMRINLLGHQVGNSHSPTGAAIASAVARFEDQRRKARLPGTWILEASLTIRKLPDAAWGTINGRSCLGFNVSFQVNAVMDNGKRYERERVVFIAPHQVVVELRSARQPPGPSGG